MYLGHVPSYNIVSNTLHYILSRYSIVLNTVHNVFLVRWCDVITGSRDAIEDVTY